MPVPFNPPKSQIPNPKITPQARHPKPCPRPGLGLGQHPTTALRSLSRTRSSLRLCAPGGTYKSRPPYPRQADNPARPPTTTTVPTAPTKPPFPYRASQGARQTIEATPQGTRHEAFHPFRPLTIHTDTGRIGRVLKIAHAMPCTSPLTLPYPSLQCFEASRLFLSEAAEYALDRVSLNIDMRMLRQIGSVTRTQDSFTGGHSELTHELRIRQLDDGELRVRGGGARDGDGRDGARSVSVSVLLRGMGPCRWRSPEGVGGGLKGGGGGW